MLSVTKPWIFADQIVLSIAHRKTLQCSLVAAQATLLMSIIAQLERALFLSLLHFLFTDYTMCS